MRKFCMIVLAITLAAPAFAAEKKWNAKGDAQTWTDTANWTPTGEPVPADDVKVDMKDASVEVPENFESKSLTIGGKKESTVSLTNFVDGTIEPNDPTDNAVMNRRDGHLVLKGSGGKVTLKGSYKDTEEVLAEEPSFMLYVK